MVSRYGCGASMAKFDVKAAYQNIGIHPDDHSLHSMKWHLQFYVDLIPPFGLRSALFIFNSVVDMVEWILLNQHHVSDLWHYLNNFYTAGSLQSVQCTHNLNTALAVSKRLWLPLHPNKCVGPSTSFTVLGIEQDSLIIQQLAHLPKDKLLAPKELILSWLQHH